MRDRPPGPARRRRGASSVLCEDGGPSSSESGLHAGAQEVRVQPAVKRRLPLAGAEAGFVRPFPGEDARRDHDNRGRYKESLQLHHKTSMFGVHHSASRIITDDALRTHPPLSMVGFPYQKSLLAENIFLRIAGAAGCRAGRCGRPKSQPVDSKIRQKVDKNCQPSPFTACGRHAPDFIIYYNLKYLYLQRPPVRQLAYWHKSCIVSVRFFAISSRGRNRQRFRTTSRPESDCSRSVSLIRQCDRHEKANPSKDGDAKPWI